MSTLSSIVISHVKKNPGITPKQFLADNPSYPANSVTAIFSKLTQSGALKRSPVPRAPGMYGRNTYNYMVARRRKAKPEVTDIPSITPREAAPETATLRSKINAMQDYIRENTAMKIMIPYHNGDTREWTFSYADAVLIHDQIAARLKLING